MTINDVYLPYLENKSRFLILFGGSGSGKSVFAAQKIIIRCKTERPHKFLVLRKVGATIKDSVFSELKEVIYSNGWEREFQINRSDYSFIHFPTNNQVICKGLDEPEKIKSIQGITGGWIEESTEFESEDLDQLNLRIRGVKKNYIQWICTFNPIDEEHFLKSDYVESSRNDVTFLHTTYKDNYFLDDDYKQVLENLKTTNELYYDVYCLGLWGVVDKSNKFLYKFDRDIHVKESKYEQRLPIRMSFDFNIDPMTVQVYQREGNKLWFFDKIRLINSDVYDVCNYVKSQFNYRNLVVTGDASGRNRTAATRGKKSFWHIIKNELNLSDSQIRLRSRNLDLISSRNLCNSALRFCEVTIDPGMKELISDCLYAKVNDYGELIKDRDKNKNDDLDGFRYAIDAEFPELITNPKKHKKIY